VSDETILTELLARYVRSFLHGDVEWYREHLADDFLCIESNGSVLDKARFLQKAAEGPDLAEYQLEQVRIRIYDGFALVHGKASFRRLDATTGRSHLTGVYRKEGGAWRAISAQTTRTLSPRKESLL
jgi:hypothetical protein